MNKKTYKAYDIDFGEITESERFKMDMETALGKLGYERKYDGSDNWRFIKDSDKQYGLKPHLFDNIWINPDSKTVLKVDATYEKGRYWSDKPVEFTPNELKVLDQLGCRVSKRHTDITGQEIEDWYE